MSESSPLPVGTFAGHKDGITYIDTKVSLQTTIVITWLSPLTKNIITKQPLLLSLTLSREMVAT